MRGVEAPARRKSTGTNFGLRFSVFKKYRRKLKETVKGNDRDFPVFGHFFANFFGFLNYRSIMKGNSIIENRALIRKANLRKSSGYGSELHTRILELGLRGATHALRVLSSRKYPLVFGHCR